MGAGAILMDAFNFAPRADPAMRRRRALFDAVWDSEQCDRERLFFEDARKGQLGRALCVVWWKATGEDANGPRRQIQA